jgi:hypothetical protein
LRIDNGIVRPQFWLWPNLLSLDAPLVAVLWQVLFLRCFHVPGSTLPAVLLVSAVWLIYAADRALDSWRGAGSRPRHEFYRRHWRAVLPVWGAVFMASACLAWTSLSPVLWARGLWLCAAVALYFVAVHLLPVRWPKEAAVAVLFALGASLAAWTRVRSASDVLTVLLFCCLCWINCLAIEQWEQGSHRWPVGVLAGGVALAAILLLSQERPILGSAEAASAMAFVWLDRSRCRLSPDALRVLADVALLSPIFFLPLAGMRF